MLGSKSKCARVGAITLRPHQQWAVTRAEAALEEFGGVLLCDDVGLGKTFVALAIARSFSRSVIVAPAGLTSMWRGALDTTGTEAGFVTFERLSREKSRPTSRVGFDLVIVDEAHHARNPATTRYQGLAALARDARVVLLTATPIHNHTAELIALLALFLGSRAASLTSNELARCVVRREHGALAQEIGIPEIIRVPDHEISDNPAIVEELMSLPPALPVRGGGMSGVLIGRGLVHQWASSEAALREAMRRRLARAAALSASLESGSYPTAGELKTWIYGEGALQLGFPELLSSQVEDAASLLRSVRAHADALQAFHARHRADGALDAERATVLSGIRAAQPNSRIVAFAQYAETVSMLYGRLAPAGGVAMLDARGGVVAGGKLTRAETLVPFAPRGLNAKPPPPSERINLLLTTDLLSEGVNLQDADVLVHLDLPWTAARMEQRVGRLARLGSLHSRVHVYLLRPPPSAAAALRNELIVQRKWNTAKREIGSSANAPLAHMSDLREGSTGVESVPAKAQRLHAILERWAHSGPSSNCLDTQVATVQAPVAGFIAAVSVDDRPVLLVSSSAGMSVSLDAQIEACLLGEGDELRTDPHNYQEALGQIHAWLEHDLASSSAGVAGSQSRARRRLLQRIETVIQNAPPHVRAARSQLAADARSIATRQHGAAVEAELALLARSELPDHEWLEAMVGLRSDGHPSQRSANPAPTLMIEAVLLLLPTVSRSRSPRAPGSP